MALTITPVNDAPVARDGGATLAEDGSLIVDLRSLGSDVDSAVLQAAIVAAPAHGTLTSNADGTFTYTPTANFNGSDTLRFTLTDGELVSNEATLSLTVTPVNDAPVLSDSAAALAEDTTLVFAPLGTASDVDGDTLAASIVAGPAHGSLAVNPDGSFAYTPDANYFGADSFTYKVNDGQADSNVATVTLTITPVNDAPVAHDGSVTLAEDGSLIVDLRSLGSDVDSAVLQATIASGPAHGTLVGNSDGTFTYRPTANFNGSDTLRFTLTDGELVSNEATLSLVVTPVNDAPTAANLNATVSKGGVVALAPLALAADAEGDALTAQVVAGPAHGSLTVNADGSFSYRPEASYVGSDAFTYKVNDGQADSNVATATLTITAVDQAPVAQGGSATLAEDASLVIDLRSLGSDAEGETLQAAVLAGPAHGTLARNTNGTYMYTPAANFFGDDTLRFTLSDGELVSNEATLSIVVTPVNDAPVLSDGAATLAEDTTLVFAPLASSSDVDGDTLAASIVAGPAHGSLAVNADGSFAYTPEANYFGADSFTYKVNDGQADSNVATLTLTITPVNDAPVAHDGTAMLAEDASLIVDLRSLGSDVDSAVLQAAIVAGPAHGTLDRNADGTFTYTPAANFNGSDTLRFTLTDGELVSNEATLSLTVTPVNDAPVLADRALTLAEDTTLVLDPLAAASDVDGDTLAASIVAGPAHGSLAVNVDGTFSYTPQANYFGADSFTYRVSDGQADSNVATVTLAIAPVNDAPVAHDGTAMLAEDASLIFDLRSLGVDVDSAVLQAAIVAGPAHGTLVGSADGTFTYTPTANFNGSDTLRFALTDGELVSNEASLNIVVTPVNDAPTAANLSATVSKGGVVTLAPLALAADAEGDALTAQVVAGPAHGSLTVNADGSFSYRPEASYVGSDAFTYKVNDGQADSNVATATLTITAVNQAPVAQGGSATLAEDASLVIDLRSLGSDAEGATLQAAVIAGPAHGTLLANADGTFTYTPAANFNGGDSLRFTLSDGEFTSNQATLSIAVTPVNDAPLVSDSQATLAEDTTLVFDPLAGASDVEGDALLARIVAGPAHGAVTVTDQGGFAYRPDREYNGSDSFTYKVSDGQADSRIATVALTIGAVNDAPVAQGGNVALAEDASLVVDLRSLGSDVDSTALQAAIVAGPAHGTLARNADGTYTYTPEANFFGADSLRFTLSDGELASNEATLSFGVTPVNDAPTAANLSASVGKGGVVRLAPLASAADVEGNALSAQVVAGPAHGSVTVNVDGSLSYRPEASYVGGDAFTYKVSDGQADSNVATVTLTINGGDAAPVLTLTAGDVSVSREVLSGGWGGVGSGTPVDANTGLNGLTLVGSGGGTAAGFGFWSGGVGTATAVGNRGEWRSANSGTGTSYQTLGIERSVATIAEAIYTLSLACGGEMGLAAEDAQIGVYVDGQRVALFSTATLGDGLTWLPLNVQFAGNGQQRTVRIVLEGGANAAAASGVAIDYARLVETMPTGAGTVYGMAGEAIALPAVEARLAEAEGSQVLRIELAGLPAGSRVSDGEHSVTLGSGQSSVDLSGWNLAKLRFMPPPGGQCSAAAESDAGKGADDGKAGGAEEGERFELQVRATATDSRTGSMASATQELTVVALAGTAVPTPVGLNPYVTLLSGASVDGTERSLASPIAVAGALALVGAGSLYAARRTRDEEEAAVDPESSQAPEGWLRSLEASAKRQWAALMGG